jgi:MFS family permease
MVQQGLPSIRIPIQRDLHLGLAGLGILLGAANAATAASVYAWGRWSDRVGDRRILLAGLLVAVPGLVAAGGAASSGHRASTILGLLIAGVGVGAGTAALLGRWPIGFPRDASAPCWDCVRPLFQSAAWWQQRCCRRQQA